jgi:pimeloyl-ACP methyl ester carboxylesterase
MAEPSVHFIHGLNSSHHSFAYLAKELGLKAKIDYESHQALTDSVLQVAKQLPKNEPIILVGHSLGGVIAMLIAHAKTHDIQKVVTISSPLAGSKAAAFARWIVSGLKVLGDITPSSVAMKLIEAEKAPCPVLSIISTGGGLSTAGEPNDSVVTVASQRALPYAKKVEVKANHFEILMHDKVIDAVRKFIQPQS